MSSLFKVWNRPLHVGRPLLKFFNEVAELDAVDCGQIAGSNNTRSELMPPVLQVTNPALLNFF